MRIGATLTAVVGATALLGAGVGAGAGAAVAQTRVDATAARASAGAQLAYVRGTTTSFIWAGRLGSPARRLGPGQTPLLAPDGDWIAMVVQSGNDVAVQLRSTTGGGARTFPVPGNADPQPLAFSSDSRYLAVSLDNYISQSAAASSLEVIDTTTMTVTKLATGFVSGGSFAPAGVGAGSDELVFALSTSLAANAPVNLYTISPSGGTSTQLSTDGRSLNPVWGRRGIVFDDERIRGGYAFPADQLWLASGGGLSAGSSTASTPMLTQLTHMRIPALVGGLVPIDVSTDGNRLLAEYSGQDTSYAYRVQLSPLRVSPVLIHGQTVQGGAISRDGQRLLIDQGAFENAPSDGVVKWVGFFGGAAHVLAHGSYPSWNW